MEDNRLALHEKLVQIMTDSGYEPKVYFQPPESVKLVYPCIIYRLRSMPSYSANDDPYLTMIGYDITYISRSPTDSIPEKLAKTRYFVFDRYYTADQLHHYSYVYTTNL